MTHTCDYVITTMTNQTSNGHWDQCAGTGSGRLTEEQKHAIKFCRRKNCFLVICHPFGKYYMAWCTFQVAMQDVVEHPLQLDLFLSLEKSQVHFGPNVLISWFLNRVLCCCSFTCLHIALFCQIQITIFLRIYALINLILFLNTSFSSNW